MGTDLSVTSTVDILLIFAAKAFILTTWLLIRPLLAERWRLFRKKPRAQQAYSTTKWGGDLRYALPRPTHAAGAPD